MGWLSSLFTSFDSSQRARRRQELSSTHAAFSLPTSSPILGTHPDAFNPDALHTPDPERGGSPSYTYPPQGKGAYGHLPSPGLASRPGSASLLPTHMDQLHSPLSPQGRYPMLSNTWDRLRSWLNREYPELGDTLNYGILPQDLANIEMQFGFALPPAVRESYLCVDGQEAESAAGCAEGLFFGLTLLPLEYVLEEWRFWREVDGDTTTGANPKLLGVMQSIPPGWIRREYSNRGWIPLIKDNVGNYIGVDINPGEEGSAGQVIVFGRDFDTKVVLWNGDGPAGWAKWLAAFVEELETGEGFEIGNNDNSDGDEDDIGYENYYHDGSGRGAGDSGGDSGAGGGLRLTGEYRGWNVLEAWGDRSLRKWHEAGLLPEYPFENDETAFTSKTSENVGLGVVDLAEDSSAGVPIPVISEDEPIPAPPPKPSSSHLSRSSQPNAGTHAVPTISVSRPPAPRPVEVPTQRDIDSESLPESIHSGHDEDLEAGRSVAMREFRDESEGPISSRDISRPYAPLRRETSDATGSSIPPTPPPPSFSRSATDESTRLPLSLSLPSSPNVPDLLGSAPKLDTALIQPSISTSSSQSGETSPTGSSDSNSHFIDDLSESEDEAPVASVRLVGGGGTTGAADDGAAVESSTDADANTAAPEEEPTPEAVAVTPEPETKPTHKKNKSSLAGLKKLALSRRKGSSASVKEASSPVPK